MRTLAVAGIVVALAGCTAAPTPAPTPPPILTVTPSPGLAPSAVPEIQAGKCEGTLKGGSGIDRAAMMAWICRQPQKYLSGTARTVLNDVPRSEINMDWAFVSCDDIMGPDMCIYRNNIGSDIGFWVPPESPDIIKEVRFDRTIFHHDAKRYAQDFVLSWIGLNFPQVAAMGTPEVVSFTKSHKGPPGVLAFSPMKDRVGFDVYGTRVHYRVILGGSLGHPHAVTEVSLISQI